jgi:hypothetical protein
VHPGTLWPLRQLRIRLVDPRGRGGRHVRAGRAGGPPGLGPGHSSGLQGRPAHRRLRPRRVQGAPGGHRGRSRAIRATQSRSWPGCSARRTGCLAGFRRRRTPPAAGPKRSRPAAWARSARTSCPAAW